MLLSQDPTSSWPGLSSSISSKIIEVNDLDMHILEALPPDSSRPSRGLVLLLHGFPELAYSWRKVMIPLSKAGYHVIAPDQRGYGRTRPHNQSKDTKVRFEDDVAPYRLLNLVTDIVALVYALGYNSVAAVVGHDCGSRVAGNCALIRPDLFKSVVMMSAPFTGAPSIFPAKSTSKPTALLLDEQLATLFPPRKHYTVYYSTPEANEPMSNPPQGLHSFFRAYYHVKSADWAPNNPQPLASKDPSSFAVLPHYYIMPLADTVPDSVERDAPSAEEVEKNTWLTEEELGVYVSEYTATGFQGGLNWYRCMTDPGNWASDLRVFSGKKIEIPAMFIAGKSDWGTYQYPGAAETMRDNLCTKMGKENFMLVEGAGHWVQQEQSDAVVELLLGFLDKNSYPTMSLEEL